ncbi:DUF3077 domain-containing protein [Pseudomonas sp. X10]
MLLYPKPGGQVLALAVIHEIEAAHYLSAMAKALIDDVEMWLRQDGGSHDGGGRPAQDSLEA